MHQCILKKRPTLKVYLSMLLQQITQYIFFNFLPFLYSDIMQGHPRRLLIHQHSDRKIQQNIKIDISAATPCSVVPTCLSITNK